MKTKNIFLTAALVAASFTTYAQVGIGTPTPDASAALDITSITKGFLSPRMSTTQRNAIATPAVGLQVYNTTTNQLQVNTGTTAVPVWSNAAGTNADSKFVYNPTRTSTDLQYLSDGVTLRSGANANTFRIKDDGGIAVGFTGNNILTSTRIASYVNRWNSGFNNYNFYSSYDLPQITADTPINVYDFQSNAHINIATGITASGGGLRGINGTIVRNTTGDAGTLNTLVGVYSSYGNGINSTGTTTNAYGFYAFPYAQAGLVTNSYDYYASNTNGSNVTNAWGLYIVGSSKKNYVQGNFGIGTTTPAAKLQVAGTTIIGNGTATATALTGSGSLQIDGAATNYKSFDAAASTTIDFSKSNLAFSTASAGSFTLSGMKDGGCYTLAVQGTTAGVFAPTHTGFTFMYLTSMTTTASKDALFTFLVIGTKIYCSMTSVL